MSDVNHVEGIHNDGAISALVAFEMNGKGMFDQVIIPYKGGRPTQAYLDSCAQRITGCKTAQVVSYVNVDQGFEEDNYTCPGAHHVAPMNPPTAPVGNHYETVQPTVIDDSKIILVKTKSIRVLQTTAYSQKN